MTATTIRVQMAQRKDTAANWTAANPILLSGEIGYETDTKKFKIGNGSTNWNSLAYLPIPDGSGNLTITGNLEIGSTGSLTFEGSTADGFETTLAVTNPTADRTITLPDTTGTVITSGDTGTVTSTMLADGTIVDADVSATAEIAVSKLANGTANQVIVTDGANVSWSDDLTLAGNLTVNGTTTTINTQDLLVEDKNIIIGNVDTPTDVTADGGGITLKGATDKTINWVDATDAWTSSERFSIPLGSTAAPSLTFTGDPNTGIYSPGADQVAISTGGSGRLFVASDGKIGVAGTPFNPLDVFGSATLGIRYKSSGSYAGIIADNTSSTGGGYFAAYQNGTQKAIFGVTGAFIGDTSADSGIFAETGQAIRFFTNGSVTERLRITSAGLVGVGTSSPSVKLEVSGTGTDCEIRSVNGTVNAQWYQDTSIGASVFGTFSNNALTFRTNGSRALTIDTSQRVGIGTTSPTQLLHVGGVTTPTVSATPTAIRLDNTYTGSPATNQKLKFYLYNDGSEAYGITVGDQADFQYWSGGVSTGIHRWFTSNTERARIDSSGRLLVGTTTAVGSSNAVVIKGTSGVSNASIYLGNTANASTLIAGNTLGFIEYGSADGGVGAQVLAAADGTWSSTSDCPTRLVFSTTVDGASSPTERFRISNGGGSSFYADTNTLTTATAQAAGTTFRVFTGAYSATNTTSGTISFQVFSNGNVQNTNNSYGAISDIKLKENIVDANSQWDDLKALQVRKYNFKEGQTHTQIGLVAQEVELVSPGLVTESPDRDLEGNDLGTVTKSVNYSVLYMKAVKALQEAMERIETLEQRLNDAGIN
jgi:hypothetical protein